MPILGAHQSIAGGYFRAVQRARETGCDCVQLFTKNNNQWRCAAITAEAAAAFRRALAEPGVSHPLAHDSYLINLASPDPTLWRKSVTAFVDELRRAEILGIPYVVTHPGSYTDGTERTGLRRVIRALDEIDRRTAGLAARCLLETTAGQGTALGWRAEQLAEILDGVRNPRRLGVCLDTCHIFAAGYPLARVEDYEATMAALDAAFGLATIHAIHLNDSLRPLGSRVDRHAHIGKGKIGKAAFRHLVNDPRFANVPMYLETPKGEENGVNLDVINLRTLRKMIPRKGGMPARFTDLAGPEEMCAF